MAKTGDEIHSLHVTVSTNRANSIVEILTAMLPDLCAAAWEKGENRLLTEEDEDGSDSYVRAPVGQLGLLDSFGVCNQLRREQTYPNERRQFSARISAALTVLAETGKEYVESAVDQYAREFMRTALPPVLSPAELDRSAHSCKLAKLAPATSVRFFRRHGQRLLFASETDAFVVHRMLNSRVYEELPECIMEIDEQDVDAWEQLESAYPSAVKIRDLLCPQERQLPFAQRFFDAGLLMIVD